MPQIAKTSPSHDQIALWLVENPGPGLITRAAQHFGYTVSWMSTIVNSDAFRARLAEVQELCDAAVASDIPAKLRGVAALALDGLAEVLAKPEANSAEFLRDTADMALHRLGFAPAKPSATAHITNLTYQQNTLTTVDPQLLASARQHLLTHSPQQPIDPVETTP